MLCAFCANDLSAARAVCAAQILRTAKTRRTVAAYPIDNISMRAVVTDMGKPCVMRADFLCVAYAFGKV
jgi:hypothetical protein